MRSMTSSSGRPLRTRLLLLLRCRTAARVIRQRGKISIAMGMMRRGTARLDRAQAVAVTPAQGARSPSDARNRGAHARANRLRRAGALLAAMAFLAAATWWCNCALAGQDAAPGACEREVARVSRRDGVPIGVFYAVGLVESGHKGVLDPYAMNIDGRPVFAGSLERALAVFQQARGTGARLIDIGCMQVNERYHGARFSSLRQMFDPVANIEYASRFLRELHARHGTWTLAVARYHAGPDRTLEQKRYVCAVAGRMVASGLGQWTESARDFCR